MQLQRQTCFLVLLDDNNINLIQDWIKRQKKKRRAPPLHASQPSQSLSPPHNRLKHYQNAVLSVSEEDIVGILREGHAGVWQSPPPAD